MTTEDSTVALAESDNTGPPPAGPRLLDGYISRDEAAKQFGVTPRTISIWIDKPGYGLPHVLLGRAYFIPVEQAREWVAKRIHVRNQPRQPRPLRRRRAARS